MELSRRLYMERRRLLACSLAQLELLEPPGTPHRGSWNRAAGSQERPQGNWNAQSAFAMRIFYLTFAISLLLIIGGFLLPPMGIIDGSVLSAVGELLMFGVLAQLPALIDAAKNGKSIKLTKGDSSIEVSSPQD